MQGEADRQRELLDVESVAGHLFEPGSVFALLAEHRGIAVSIADLLRRTDDQGQVVTWLHPVADHEHRLKTFRVDYRARGGGRPRPTARVRVCRVSCAPKGCVFLPPMGSSLESAPVT